MWNPTVIAIVTGLVAVVTGGVISWFQADKTLSGMIVVAGTLTIVGFAAVAQLLATLRNEIDGSLSRRLPPVSLLTGAPEIVAELRAAIAGAQRFIYVTGSAGRDEQYLKLIEQRVESDALRYIRVLYYRHVSVPMQAHLLRMFSNRKAQVLYADEAHHGYFVITDKVTLILIPNRNFQDSVAIKFTGKEQQEVFLEMFTRLSALSDPVKSEERLKSLYDELKSVGH